MYIYLRFFFAFFFFPELYVFNTVVSPVRIALSVILLAPAPAARPTTPTTGAAGPLSNVDAAIVAAPPIASPVIADAVLIAVSLITVPTALFTSFFPFFTSNPALTASIPAVKVAPPSPVLADSLTSVYLFP